MRQKLTLNDVSYRNQRVAQENKQQQVLQGGQGASLAHDGNNLGSTRSFFNERTDLTATEVSPRITTKEMNKSSGQVIRINTRVIKLSTEKSTMQSLNTRNSAKRMLRTFNDPGLNSAHTVQPHVNV